MFSKKTIVIAGLMFLVALNGMVFSFNYIRKSAFYPAAVETALFFTSPLQEGVSRTTGFAENVWSRYFSLVSTARENERLRRQLAETKNQLHLMREIALHQDRLESMLSFKADLAHETIIADVVGRESSAWYQSVVINKGRADGVEIGYPVIIPEGVVGRVTGVSNRYAKVQLMIDRNSALDAMVQRTRARGIVQGLSSSVCQFEFALHRADIGTGDIVITSGYDGVFPKGLRVGRVSKIVKRRSGVFQEIEITPFVDFHRLEEVMVMLDTPVIDIDLSDN